MRGGQGGWAGRWVHKDGRCTGRSCRRRHRRYRRGHRAATWSDVGREHGTVVQCNVVKDAALVAHGGRVCHRVLDEDNLNVGSRVEKFAAGNEGIELHAFLDVGVGGDAGKIDGEEIVAAANANEDTVTVWKDGGREGDVGGALFVRLQRTTRMAERQFEGTGSGEPSGGHVHDGPVGGGFHGVRRLRRNAQLTRSTGSSDRIGCTFVSLKLGAPRSGDAARPAPPNLTCHHLGQVGALEALGLHGVTQCRRRRRRRSICRHNGGSKSRGQSR
mmetsp:Transcript_16100/g.50340  ORF Transcript_16100/g.50340 Transcript_16100/m.50340 type:complete len:273 (+) Transcript_16100:1956-2774(+)